MPARSRSSWLSWLGAIAFGAACLACCLPLLIGFLGGFGLLSLGSGVILGWGWLVIAAAL